MSVLSNRKPVRKPRPKPARSIRLAVPPNAEGRNGILVITVGKQTDQYFVSRVPSDFGRGFCLEKIGDAENTAYHVNLSAERNTCECKGWCRWQHCKHADGLAALVAAGRL